MEHNELYSPFNTGKTATRELVLHKDNINTVEYIVLCLVGVLKIHPTNAEQLVVIMAYKGKATILTGKQELLSTKHSKLTKLGLFTTIE